MKAPLKRQQVRTMNVRKQSLIQPRVRTSDLLSGGVINSRCTRSRVEQDVNTVSGRPGFCLLSATPWHCRNSLTHVVSGAVSMRECRRHACVGRCASGNKLYYVRTVRENAGTAGNSLVLRGNINASLFCVSPFSWLQRCLFCRRVCFVRRMAVDVIESENDFYPERTYYIDAICYIIYIPIIRLPTLQKCIRYSNQLYETH